MPRLGSEPTPKIRRTLHTAAGRGAGGGRPIIFNTRRIARKVAVLAVFRTSMGQILAIGRHRNIKLRGKVLTIGALSGMKAMTAHLLSLHFGVVNDNIAQTCGRIGAKVGNGRAFNGHGFASGNPFKRQRTVLHIVKGA